MKSSFDVMTKIGIANENKGNDGENISEGSSRSFEPDNKKSNTDESIHGCKSIHWSAEGYQFIIVEVYIERRGKGKRNEKDQEWPINS